jgi:replicative DNA helicase
VTAPRFSRDAERSVLGAILNAHALDEHAGRKTTERILRTGLTAGDFYYTSHGALFGVIVDMHRRRLQCDPLSVALELEAETHRRLRGLGSFADLDIDRVRGHLVHLATETISFTRAEQWALQLRILAQARAEEMRCAA